MNPVNYCLNDDVSISIKYGFIAQEMYEVLPQATTGEPEGDKMMGMDYGQVTPVIVAALKEAITEITALKARITALEA